MLLIFPEKFIFKETNFEYWSSDISGRYDFEDRDIVSVYRKQIFDIFEDMSWRLEISIFDEFWYDILDSIGRFENMYLGVQTPWLLAEFLTIIPE